MANISVKEGTAGTFILSAVNRNGKTKRIFLDEEDIIRLGQSAQHLRDQILARRSRPGAIVVAMTPVTQIEINTHNSEILLTMIDGKGTRIGFALPPLVARPLADRLPQRVAEIEAAQKAATRQ